MQLKSQRDASASEGARLHVLDFLGLFASSRTVRLALGNLIIFSIITASIFGGGITSSFAEGSLPGDPLYPIKIFIEKAQIVLTPGEGNKTKLQSEIAEKRLDELESATNKPEAGKQKEAVKMAAQNFQKEVRAVKTRLEKIERKASPEKVVAAAKAVTERTGNFEKTLDQASKKSSQEGKKEIQKAKAAVAEADTKALEVLVAQHKETASISTEEVASIIQEKIERTEKKLEEDCSIPVPYAPGQLLLPGATVSVSGEEVTFMLPTSSSVSSTICGARQKLEEAKKELENKDLSKALEKTTEAKKIVQEAEKQNLSHSEEETKNEDSSSSPQDDKSVKVDPQPGVESGGGDSSILPKN